MRAAPERRVIAEVISFLRGYLDGRIRVAMGGNADDPTPDKVVFVDGSQSDPIVFQLDAVTELLINVEEDRVLRSAEPYLRRGDDGQLRRVQPDIRLSLCLLFVARFTDYETAWSYLSMIVEEFQRMRVFDPADPTLSMPAGMDKLVVELMTLGLAEQNEIWNALRTPHMPSLLYRVKLVVVRDQQPAEVALVSTVEALVTQAKQDA